MHHGRGPRALEHSGCVADVMSAKQAVELYEMLDANGVECWVMGGWGVDALLGRVSRDHKDLDLLVHVSSLRAYAGLVASHGFVRKLEWSENRAIEGDGMRLDSAFSTGTPTEGRSMSTSST